MTRASPARRRGRERTAAHLRLGRRNGRVARAARAHLRVVLAAILFFAAGAGPCPANQPAPVPDEYDLKAVWLYHFSQFVDWPADSFPRDNSPLVIGVYGRNPFGDRLERLAARENDTGRPIVVVYYRTITVARNCHILFIGDGQAGNLARITAALRGVPVLTVSDAENFCRRGGMVEFHRAGTRIRLRVNMDAIKESGLVVSAKLLRLADVVSRTAVNGPAD